MVKTGTLFSLQRGSSSLHHYVGIYKKMLGWPFNIISYYIIYPMNPHNNISSFQIPTKILPPWNRWGDRHTAAPALVVWAAGRGSGWFRHCGGGSWESWDLGTAPRFKCLYFMGNAKNDGAPKLRFVWTRENLQIWWFIIIFPIISWPVPGSAVFCEWLQWIRDDFHESSTDVLIC